jgi:hypothetical protein
MSFVLLAAAVLLLFIIVFAQSFHQIFLLIPNISLVLPIGISILLISVDLFS